MWDFEGPHNSSVADGKWCYDHWENCKAWYIDKSPEYDYMETGRYPAIKAFAGGLQGTSGSWMQLHHLLTMLENKRFMAYDYGPAGNNEKYANASAPNYDLTNVKNEVVLVFAGADPLTQDPALLYWLTGSSGLKIHSGQSFDKVDHWGLMYGSDMSYMDYVLEEIKYADYRYST
jgi:hypothetical protein